jgi:hypothetical protein
MSTNEPTEKSDVFLQDILVYVQPTLRVLLPSDPDVSQLSFGAFAL